MLSLVIRKQLSPQPDAAVTVNRGKRQQTTTKKKRN